MDEAKYGLGQQVVMPGGFLGLIRDKERTVAGWVYTIAVGLADAKVCEDALRPLKEEQ